MLGPFGGETWRRRAFWLRAAGISLLVAATFLPLGGAAIFALLVVGILPFSIGAILWLLREEGTWRR